MNNRLILDKKTVIMWYLLNEIERNAENEIRAVIQVPAASPWFDGHFPGEPVLPGLAQISMVFDVIRKCLKANGGYLNVSRVRFKRIIRPEDRLEVMRNPPEKRGRCLYVSNSYSR